jgi:hypothetical protein
LHRQTRTIKFVPNYSRELLRVINAFDGFFTSPTRLIRAGVWNAYLPVLLPGRLLQLGGGALR